MKFTQTKIIVACLVVSVLAVPVAAFIDYKLNPPTIDFLLTYTEKLNPQEKSSGIIPIQIKYCFKYPLDLEANNDLQDFFIATTKDALKETFLSDDSGIDEFSYKTTEGCEHGANVILDADKVRDNYVNYQNNLRQ